MQYRVLTVSREYGSGGSTIAAKVAAELGWRLVDNELITTIARNAKLDPSLVHAYDERVDSWLHRLNRGAFRSMVLSAGVMCSDADFFDADCMASFTRGAIQEAYSLGNCVIVGRGSQCILDKCTDVFRTFVYAPPQQRLERVCKRTGRRLTIDDINAIDTERARHIHQYFGCDWKDPNLYDLMISSAHGCEITASTILHAVTKVPQPVS